jgi:hypothetical protein
VKLAEAPRWVLVTEREAGDWGLYREALDKHRRYGESMPTLFPKPTRPDQRVRPGAVS